MNSPEKPTLKVEQLLELKRQEKPDAAFWSRFDRELHAKMLATLQREDSRAHVFWSYCAARLRAVLGAGAIGAMGAAALTLMLMQAPDTVVEPAPVQDFAQMVSEPIAEAMATAPADAVISSVPALARDDFSLSILGTEPTGSFARQMEPDSISSGTSRETRDRGIDTLNRGTTVRLAQLHF